MATITQWPWGGMKRGPNMRPIYAAASFLRQREALMRMHRPVAELLGKANLKLNTNLP